LSSGPPVPPPAESGFVRYAEPRVRVFLADDDEDLRESARSILSEAGYDVTVAADGREALERMAAMADADIPLPDVLILDFVMPRLSGLGVLRGLRFVRRVPPAIILTGFPDPSVKTFAAKLGVFRVLRKPLSGEDLCAAVRDALLDSSKKDETAPIAIPRAGAVSPQGRRNRRV
jgi:DNA-binding response OmpR family regulator